MPIEYGGYSAVKYEKARQKAGLEPFVYLLFRGSLFEDAELLRFLGRKIVEDDTRFHTITFHLLAD